MSDLGSGWYIMTGNEYIAGPFRTEDQARTTKQLCEYPGRVAYLELGRFNHRENTAL